MTASHRFFEGRKPAAGLKHAILNRYLPKFVTMTGSQSAGRAFWIDAYAGPGEYEDGTLGSPTLVAELADALKETVQLDCCFIEKNRVHASTLRQVLRGAGRDWPVLVGSAEKQLQTAVDMADELPLLTFLDPFGVTVPAEVLEETLLTRPQPGPWRSDRKKTEVILHYSDQAVRRMAGVPKRQGILERSRQGPTTLERLTASASPNDHHHQGTHARVGRAAQASSSSTSALSRATAGRPATTDR